MGSDINPGTLMLCSRRRLGLAAVTHAILCVSWSSGMPDNLEDLDFLLTDDTAELAPECPSATAPAPASMVSRRLL